MARPATVFREAEVSFEDARTPERATHVRVASFDGPLALLVSLIEQRRLDILDVPLGDLAGAYLEALSGITGDRLPHLSSFVGVSAQLILIKSRAILPRPPVLPDADVDGSPDPEAELRARLVVYKKYRDAAQRLGDRLETGLVSVHREGSVATASGTAGARPPDQAPLDPGILAESLAFVIASADPVAPPLQIMGRGVTLEQRASVLRRALREASVVIFQELLRDVRDRVVVTVTFLAMLELVKRREMVAQQDQPWGPIVCRALRQPVR